MTFPNTRPGKAPDASLLSSEPPRTPTTPGVSALFEPKSRHARGYGALWNGFGSLLLVVAGLGALVEGHLWGLAVIPVGLWFGLEAFLCFRAGNI